MGEWQRVHPQSKQDWARARDRGLIDEDQGKGSHIALYYGTRRTIVKDRRKEIAPGLLSTMIRDLGLQRNDFR